MIWFVAWLLAVEAAGMAFLPLSVRLLNSLPDRGFFFAKPLGVLLLGYVCWLLAVLGILSFQQQTLIAVLVVGATACWIKWGRETIKQLSGAWPAVIASQLLFLAALAVAAFIRAHSPDISGTEKPMDFAFLHAIARTDTLPPEDPWMSGHSISYYYFGYYLLGMLAKLSGVQASVAYNLAVALVFAMMLAGSYSIAFNLLSALRPAWSLQSRLGSAMVAPILVGVMGNLEIALEVLAAQGYSNPGFWQLMGIKNLQPSTSPDGIFPTDFWWWWRASRIIPTTKPDGINEFPYFSFLLADLHPHYTALPWTLLVVALSLATVLRRVLTPVVAVPWTYRLTAAVILGFPLVGNSWDFPTYAALFVLNFIVPLTRDEWSKSLLIARVRLPVLVTALSVALYAPFFLGFSSQTRGLGLSADRTPLPSLLIIFGTVFLGLAFSLAWRGWGGVQDTPKGWPRRRLLAAGGLSLIVLSPVGGGLVLLTGLVVLGISAVIRLFEADETPSRGRAAEVFHLLLVAAGIGLVVVPEFVFLMDLFGTRMNTVFKFHYQAWVLLGIASAVGVAWLVGSTRANWLRLGVVLPFALLVGTGLLYPFGATASRLQDLKTQPTLDGAAFFQYQHPDEYSAIRWLGRNASGRPVVLEATGGSYTSYARVSTFSGLPTVLGWGGHEAQWGRDGAELQQRTRDIDAIYSTASAESALQLLRKYRVEYVFVGTLEMEKYGPGVSSRFGGLLEPAYRQGTVAVYRVPSSTGRG